MAAEALGGNWKRGTTVTLAWVFISMFLSWALFVFILAVLYEA